jgi:hypothetical protein
MMALNLVEMLETIDEVLEEAYILDRAVIQTFGLRGPEHRVRATVQRAPPLKPLACARLGARARRWLTC